MRIADWIAVMLKRLPGSAAVVAATLSAVCSAAPRAVSSAARDLEFVIPSRDARLAAILRLPAGRPPYPAVVLVHGSGRQTGTGMLDNAARLADMGVAVVAYDKRGVGRSTGEYANVGVANSVDMFGLLADDVNAAVSALTARADVDPNRIGLVGFSQGGWIAPLAASRNPAVAFVITISGPAVSVGEEIAYSRLAGEDPGSLQGLADTEVDRRMQAFRGPYGYDPEPVLKSLTVPSLWILGERDRSLPVRRTLSVLERTARQHARPVTTHVLPGVNHQLLNPQTGEQPDFWRVIRAWLEARRLLAKLRLKPLRKDGSAPLR